MYDRDLKRPTCPFRLHPRKFALNCPQWANRPLNYKCELQSSSRKFVSGSFWPVIHTCGLIELQFDLEGRTGHCLCVGMLQYLQASPRSGEQILLRAKQMSSFDRFFRSNLLRPASTFRWKWTKIYFLHLTVVIESGLWTWMFPSSFRLCFVVRFLLKFTFTVLD